MHRKISLFLIVMAMLVLVFAFGCEDRGDGIVKRCFASEQHNESVLSRLAYQLGLAGHLLWQIVCLGV